MELRLLRYFVAVAQHGQFTRAAESLYMSQPPLSQQIRQLEQEVGLELLTRRPHGVELTPAGTVFLKRAQEILAMCDGAVREAREAGMRQQDVIHIAALAYPVAHLLPRAVEDFHREYPNVRVRVTRGASIELEDMVANGTAGLGIVRLPLQHSHLANELLFTERVVLAVSPGHKLADRGEVELQDAAGERFLTFDRSQSGRWYDLTLDSCVQAGFVPQIVFESNDHASMGRFLQQEGGVMLMPERSLQLMAAPIAALGLKPPLASSVALIWDRGRYLSPEARAFMEMLKRARNAVSIRDAAAVTQ